MRKFSRDFQDRDKRQGQNIPCDLLSHSRAKKRENVRRYFRITDFYTFMLPCIFLCQILGLFSHGFNSKGFTTSKFWLIYSNIVSVTCFASLLIILYHINVSRSLSYEDMQSNLQVNCYLSCGAFVLFFAHVLQRQRIRFLKELFNLVSTLPSKEFSNYGKFIYTKDIFGFLFLSGQFYRVWSKSEMRRFLWIVALHVAFVIFVMDMLYVNCVCMLKMCFRRINEKLRRIKNLSSQENEHQLSLRRVHRVQRNFLIELRLLEKYYLNTGNALNNLNNTFTFHLIATIFHIFVEITFSLYYYILWMNGVVKSINFEGQIWTLYVLSYTAYYIIKIIILAWVCETTKDQAANVGTSINEVLVTTTDKEITEELQLFAVQTLQPVNVFTAKLIMIDASLLTSIAGSSTTYLLILIQFLLSNKNEDNT